MCSHNGVSFDLYLYHISFYSYHFLFTYMYRYTSQKVMIMNYHFNILFKCVCHSMYSNHNESQLKYIKSVTGCIITRPMIKITKPDVTYQMITKHKYIFYRLVLLVFDGYSCFIGNLIPHLFNILL